jgi:hypothetical protein
MALPLLLVTAHHVPTYCRDLRLQAHATDDSLQHGILADLAVKFSTNFDPPRSRFKSSLWSDCSVKKRLRHLQQQGSCVVLTFAAAEQA